MTLSPVSHCDAVVHTVDFTALCTVERLNLSLFYSAGNTCHIKLSICELLLGTLANRALQTQRKCVLYRGVFVGGFLTLEQQNTFIGRFLSPLDCIA